ncbi:MAG: type II toxin-antitoxin system RelE/ParE family toxin [Rhizobiaceae bacterium]|nr:type II toxin-antitoxin system RelE/ParE family toxin [Rhizobiaceae bacterium]MCV0406627.1 type II toxin-antitoxin system RelE/ParE family toxin [Rhizobiaceae bacterium]
MPRIVYAAAALRDLDRLRAFLHAKNPAAARRAGEAIRSGLRILGSQPRLGRPVEGLPEPYREWVIEFGAGGYIVRYRVDGDAVTILAVRHGREAGF